MFSNFMVQQLMLALIGGSAGGVIAAGVFAFLVIIGVFPRLVGKTKTNQHILLYETVIIIGGTIGNALDLYEFPVLLGAGTNLFLGALGMSVGVFVGCLVMSLAETLQSLPVINRRIHLAVGFQYIILAMAVGKLTGSLIYFARGMSS